MKGIQMLMLGGLLLLEGCFSLTGNARPDPTRHFVLTTCCPGEPSSGELSHPRAILVLGPVEIPRVLDRPQIVLRGKEGRIIPQEFSRWGEPLEKGMAAALARELGRQFPQYLVRSTPSPKASLPQFSLRFSVKDFSSDGKMGHFQACCEIWSGDKLLGAKPLEFFRPDPGNSMEQTVEMLHRLLVDAAGSLVQDLRFLVEAPEKAGYPHWGESDGALAVEDPPPLEPLPLPMPLPRPPRTIPFLVLEADGTCYVTVDDSLTGRRLLSKKLLRGAREELACPNGVQLAASLPKALRISGTARVMGP
jgi:uncharacterized lipoprotein YmbA